MFWIVHGWTICFLHSSFSSLLQNYPLKDGLAGAEWGAEPFEFSRLQESPSDAHECLDFLPLTWCLSPTFGGCHYIRAALNFNRIVDPWMVLNRSRKAFLKSLTPLCSWLLTLWNPGIKKRSSVQTLPKTPHGPVSIYTCKDIRQYYCLIVVRKKKISGGCWFSVTSQCICVTLSAAGVSLDEDSGAAGLASCALRPYGYD